MEGLAAVDDGWWSRDGRTRRFLTPELVRGLSRRIILVGFQLCSWERGVKLSGLSLGLTVRRRRLTEG